MKKNYTLNEHRLQVRFGDGAVHIRNDKALWDFVDEHPRESVALLVRYIKQEYLAHAGKELQVSDNSLLLEIWGHLYYEYYVLKLRRFLNFRCFDRLALKLVKPSKSIDCGEKGKDSNRWLWDMFARYTPLFFKLLPKDISSKGLKL